MEKADVLIIGAGAAGLMAAYTLAKAGKQVTVLEACNRTGGRIHTLGNSLFFKQAEVGAEFVHGQLPVTLELLQQAGIGYSPIDGEMWQYRNGTFTKNAGMIEGWDLLMKKLNALKEDTTLDAFLETHFTDIKFEELKTSVRRYAAGYDTSDPARVSMLALRNEWLHEDDEHQYRIEGGYCALIQYLANEVKANNGQIYLNEPVTELHWQQGNAKVITAEQNSYEADKVIIALPLGVLQAPANQQGAVTFYPPIVAQAEAIQKMGFGAIIKVLLQFDNAFWEDEITEQLAGESLKDMLFLFSDEQIPTWWTQAPAHVPLLTGWLGGTPAEEWKALSPEEVLTNALQSLSNIFNRSVDGLKEQLVAWHVANWTAEPYTRGSYAYDTIDTPDALKVLSQPVEDTLFFTGEYMYSGTAMGTVEAALTSGQNVAKQIMNS
ncbi:FAD-dependent oxidoreductase [Mucilaginibacter sp. Bleaf8]|uniref:flavin monoamine oxidase family protein n=1 Tax=Mucilaginibacter sp. Bleaf8 TaxID=2834430 RepID=UPI001BD1B822|nr:NAD(P)/FAD-dependent oxidoreductase [Mucilaginibacter sp. Bleaf8]MBS7563466.1 FAD-dependent oxidoreductase [Mucilaginibacter sp. Bleaf8]